MFAISQRLLKYKELKSALVIALLVFVSLVFFFKTYTPPTKLLLILFTVTILTFLILNFKVIYTIFILSFFFEFGIYYFYLPTLIFPFVAVSFIINYSIQNSEFKNQIFNYFLFFFISIVPSYFSAISHPESYLISYNLFAFIVILLITPFIFKKLDSVFWVGATYLIGCSLNAMYLIIMSFLTGKRAFGFAGIMYVDLVGVGIIIAYSGLLFFKKFRLLFGTITLLLIVALLFTQTRNSWISTGLVILMLTVYYMIKNKKFNIPDVYSVKKLILVVLSIIVITSIIGIANPHVFSRVTETKSQSTEELAVTMDFGSIATRFFIWNIAFSVFEANPIIGTGFHSFRFISYNYSNLDPFLYDTFVKNLTPHTTILALLADTGIIGFLGFVIFMFLTIKFIKENLKLSFNQNQKILSFILFWCQIYILISMIMTDAWLWGTLHMLWAVILGISVFLRRDIRTHSVSSNSD